FAQARSGHEPAHQILGHYASQPCHHAQLQSIPHFDHSITSGISISSEVCFSPSAGTTKAAAKKEKNAEEGDCGDPPSRPHASNCHQTAVPAIPGADGGAYCSPPAPSGS